MEDSHTVLDSPKCHQHGNIRMMLDGCAQIAAPSTNHLLVHSRKKERVMQIEVNNDNAMKVRKFYLSLCDQGRANFLWDNQISGGMLKLSPGQYPEAAPMHRVCRCGADPEPELGSDHSRVMCPRCGCRTASYQMPWLAWRAWDAEDLEVDDQNITIWEVM